MIVCAILQVSMVSSAADMINGENKDVDDFKLHFQGEDCFAWPDFKFQSKKD